jgi:hypothetical protein
MGENDTKNSVSETVGAAPDDAADSFVLDETVSSSSVLREGAETVSDPSVLPAIADDELDFEDRSPVFKELALPKLPELKHENRARLLMQSPNRLFFYWSTRGNPFRTLHRAFGERTENYSLVLKLIDLKKGTEAIYPVEAEGSWWFDVKADGSYRAEIGFYAPNGPYVRILFSNDIETPRKSPSQRVATSADWTVSSATFAEVLDASGFSQDAFDVAMAGDDHENAERATHAAFSGLVGSVIDLSVFGAEELRFALLALASGVSLETLRDHISAALFALLQTHTAQLTADRAGEALGEHFGISSDEIIEEESIGGAVFGASRVHFPRLTVKRGDLPPRLAPVSSLRAGFGG